MKCMAEANPQPEEPVTPSTQSTTPISPAPPPPRRVSELVLTLTYNKRYSRIHIVMHPSKIAAIIQVSTKFGDLFATETINGRVAMLGFVSALGGGNC